MPLPPFVRSPAFLGGLGSAGSGVVGIGGWQIAEGFYPYVSKQLAKEGFLENIPKPELEVSVEKGEHTIGQNPFKFQFYGCFQNFFPGATVNHSVVDTPQASDTFQTPDQTDIVSDHNPIGCSLMNFSYEVEAGSTSRGEDKKIKYVFKSEVTAKNDKFGWALWAGSKKLPTTGVSGSAVNEVAHYYLAFLKKDDADKWNILGGYSWPDMSITSGYLAANMNIWSPNRDEGNWYDPIYKSSEGKVSGSKEYSGIWAVSESGGKEVFQDIELWAGNESDKYDSDEILGREFKPQTSYIDFSKESTNSMGYGYEDADYVYESSSGWTKMSKAENITKVLNDMYVPFKGKKGAWMKTEEYCSSKTLNRMYWKDFKNWSERYNLQNFCYKKESNI